MSKAIAIRRPNPNPDLEFSGYDWVLGPYPRPIVHKNPDPKNLGLGMTRPGLGMTLPLPIIR